MCHLWLLSWYITPQGVSKILYVLVGIYLPPPVDIDVLHVLMQQITMYNVDNVLLIGDFNMAPFRDLDRMHASGPQQHGLSHWASAFHMTDVWRHFHPSDREYTCLSTTYQSMSRIDLAFASPAMLKRVISTEILSRGISDHLSVTIRTSHVEGGRVWRLCRYWIHGP